jgi:hypothetical protein
MSAPANIRSTAGFRSISLYELNSSGYPIGAATLQACTPYTVSGSVVNSGSTASVVKGTAVSGSIPYYGILHSGAKVLTINDPQPRIIPHIGDDGVFNLQVLPALEVANGELRVDKTNDVVDAIAGNIKAFTVGEANIQGVVTSQRGFENQVAAIAYSFAQDADPDSANFGVSLWDFRIFPKATVFQRDNGYGQEANERMYSFTPAFVTSHLWGTQFTLAVEGFIRGQILRGVCQYKPTFVTYLGDGSTKAFPFDSAKPARDAAKVVVWVNGVLQSSGILATVNGVGFNTAPTANAVIAVFYES